ncbi:MAG TPA: ABC transporter ATP-binding protein/permease [Pseudolysinimonas sp.]|nr:ABC transporter ATP-binding protein/permease [Pseudolysinimonas sp.]
MTLLRLDGVRRIFPGPPEVTAVAGVDLEIAAGEFVAIEGPSGGGKSTLLNILGLLDRPTSGAYAIRDRATAELTDGEMSALRSDTFGFVFQAFHLLERRPVLDSVELNLVYRAVPAAVRRTRALEALEALGVAELADTAASRLSGGQRQRVAIARALAAGTPVLIADEPTGNLDSVNGARVIEALRTVNARGVTVLLVTHDPEVAAAAGRRLRMRDGRLTELDTMARRSGADATSAPIGTPARTRFGDLVRDAAASVRTRGGRTVGGVVAVAVAVALAVGAFAVGATAQAQVSDRFDAHANREVAATWSPGDGRYRPPDAALLDGLSSLSGVVAAALLDELGGHVVTGVPERPGVIAPVFAASGDLVAAARLTMRDPLGTGPVVLIGSSLAAQLDLPAFPAHPVLLVDGTRAAIGGVIAASPRVPELSGAIVWVGDRPAFAESSRRTALLVTRAGAAPQVAAQVAVVIDAAQPGSVEVDAPADVSTLRTEIEGDLLLVLSGFTGLALLAAVAALANAMAGSVLERRAEIGLRRAVGARTRHIVGLVLIESLLIGVAGGIAGLFAGLMAALALIASQGWLPVFEPLVAPAALLGGAVIGGLGGSLAARRAARVLPGEALRA